MIFRDAQLAQLASFPTTLVRSRLDLWGKPRGRLSRLRWDAAARGSSARPRRGGRAAAEVRRLRGGGEQTRPLPQRSRSHGNCVGEESR